MLVRDWCSFWSPKIFIKKRKPTKHFRSNSLAFLICWMLLSVREIFRLFLGHLKFDGVNFLGPQSLWEKTKQQLSAQVCCRWFLYNSARLVLKLESFQATNCISHLHFRMQISPAHSVACLRAAWLRWICADWMKSRKGLRH